MSVNSIQVVSRRRKLSNVEAEHPNAEILDVTSKGKEPWVRFSPFYPHGNIPVPNTDGVTAQSVEGVWQALKVFEGEGVDVSKLEVTNMKGIKRSVRTRGRVLGHQFGLNNKKLLDYETARRGIYLPTYRHVLENDLDGDVEQIRELLTKRPVILLDYETNCDVTNLSKPLSHAGLVVAFINNTWPKETSM